ARLALAAAVAVLGVAASASAQAQVISRRSVGAPPFRLELEPHFTIGAAVPPGPGTGSGSGVGVRGSYMIAPQGFLSAVDDSVSLGVGLDFVRYRGDGSFFGTC